MVIWRFLCLCYRWETGPATGLDLTITYGAVEVVIYVRCAMARMSVYGFPSRFPFRTTVARPCTGNGKPRTTSFAGENVSALLVPSFKLVLLPFDFLSYPSCHPGYVSWSGEAR
jgi:hypothetical protein